MINKKLIYLTLMFTTAIGSFSILNAAPKKQPDQVSNAPLSADMEMSAPTLGGDDINTLMGGLTDDKEDQKSPETAKSNKMEKQQQADGSQVEATAAKFDDLATKMALTHPEHSQKFVKEYHASKDKQAVLEKWSNTHLESQEMLDAVDELYAIHQVLENIDVENAILLQKKVEDEKDPRNLLEYAHQILLKSLKDRKSQIELAKSELASIALILQYVDGNKAKDIEHIEKNSEDARVQVSEAYDVLLSALEAAHNEAGIQPLQ